MSAKFTKAEGDLIFACLKYKELPVRGNDSTRTFEKVDELDALECFRELKKGIDGDSGFMNDCELNFSNSNKQLLRSCIEPMKFGLDYLETKITALEKLLPFEPKKEKGKK